MEAGSKSIGCMKRLTGDLRKLEEEGPPGVSAAPREDNILIWDAIIFGPTDTPWDGGTFKLTLEFRENYPNTPPKVRFVSTMFHPNIYKEGDICLDILKENWRPVYDVAAVLTSIQSLLSDPNPQSPANQEASRLYSTDRKEYNRRVRQVAQQSLSDV